MYYMIYYIWGRDALYDIQYVGKDVPYDILPGGHGCTI